MASGQPRHRIAAHPVLLHVGGAAVIFVAHTLLGMMLGAIVPGLTIWALPTMWVWGLAWLGGRWWSPLVGWAAYNAAELGPGLLANRLICPSALERFCDGRVIYGVWLIVLPAVGVWIARRSRGVRPHEPLLTAP